MKRKEPPLSENNDFLKPQGSPWLWLGLILIPIIFVMISEIRSSGREAEEQVQVQQVQPQKSEPSRPASPNTRSNFTRVPAKN